MNYNQYRSLGFTTLQNGLIAYYSKLNISDAELIIIIQLEAFIQHGIYFPSNESIAANTNLSAGDVAILIQRLIDKEIISLMQFTDKHGRIGNKYNLDELYDKLDSYLIEITESNENSSKNKQVDHKTNANLDNDNLSKISRQFEIEFGRYLSPIEREEIASWISVDHYSPDIIILALREAVLSQAYSLKYVDRVLLNWQRHNLKTSEEVKNFLKRNQ